MGYTERASCACRYGVLRDRRCSSLMLSRTAWARPGFTIAQECVVIAINEATIACRGFRICFSWFGSPLNPWVYVAPKYFDRDVSGHSIM